MRISDWSSDVCSSDLQGLLRLSGGIEASLRLLHVHRIVRRAGWTLAGGGDCVESFGRVLRLGIVSLVRPKQRHDSRAQRSAKRIHCRSEEHTSELQSLMRISYAVFCLKKKKTYIERTINITL